MGNPHNVELEAAKFLHKLIQDSTDEPTKLATKLYVILQHMRSSGKENSMPYQVISRAMETVISQNNLDIEALMSSRVPLTSGSHVADSASAQSAGAPSKVHGVTTSASGSYPIVESAISSPMQFSSSSYDNHGFVAKMHKDRSVDAFYSTPSVDVFSAKVSLGKALEHDGGISNTLANTTNTVQCGVPNHVPEMGMIRNAAPRDTGKSPMSQAPSSSMPFKEQHLKQLRAQCLVFLAFRNGLMPKKLHLEIALGNFFPKEDGPHKELIEHRGKDQSINEVGSGPDMTMPFGRLDNSREIDINPAGQSSTRILAEANLYKEAENLNMMEDKNDQLTCLSERKHRLATKKMEDEVQTRKTAESLAFAMKGPQPDSILRGLAANNQENDLESCHRQIGIASQASPIVSMGKHMKAEVISRTGDGYHNEASKVLPPTSTVPHESVQDRKDNVPVQSQSRGDGNVQRNQHVDGYLSSIPLREHWQPMSGMDGQHHLVRMKNVSQDQEEEDISIPTERPRSPKYTTSEKWILEHQKRKLRTGQNWVLKQQKTEQRIAACSDKLKESVSSSEDISAKTKSVIELKKLQLLELQRRLRSDILNDFFKPIATEMDRLKAIKKHRIGRRSKQVERFEQRMKEERQKRIRERQKEFFSEIEVHRERLEDVFKMKRERWKGFNKYVREFHKRRERIYREKNDRIQREKINLLKINDVEGYLRMVQDAKSDRVKQLLKETEKYLQKLGSKLQDAKVISRQFETDMVENKTTGGVEKNEIAPETEDDTDQAKHYLESNEKYYLMAHSIKEHVAEQPTSLVGGKLREYQMNGLRWLVSLYNNHLNGILADEMGLGKTVQVIALICYLMETKNDRGPFLVVVPSSVLPGWDSEINVWAPSILKIVYSGPPEERRRLFKERIVHQKFNVLLTTYEYLMNKHDRPKLSKVHWHYIIIDEGHRIKNASCKLNADLKHYHSNHRLLLTGTPLQNNLEELWALLNFLLPNIFNSSEDFSQWFNKPFESNGDDSLDEALLSEEENLLIINRLHQVLRPFVLRRLKHKVEHQLPEKIERLVRCEASAYQKLLMRRVEDNLGAIGTSKARTVHNSVMELRNICNHPYLSHIHVEEVHDLIPMHYLPNIIRLCGKLEMLDRLLPKLKATDHRVLLFSTMTRLLDVMEDYLCWKQYRYLRLDGHTSGGDRGALLDKFNQPGSPFFIFLLSIRAGGVGVNLQAADTVIIFDTDWNPQVDLQAQARAHRIGQKRDVLVLRLETVQTVEEQVRAAAEHKLGVANQSITAGFFDNNTSAEDRREYLESLLRESKKEEVAPVLDDDALNDLIARSESEIDIFESVDKHRWEEEMAAWKKLVSGQGTGCSDPVPPLPSRLVTYEDLKPFYEAMKISEVRNPGLVSNAGIKRKSEFGGLDTQQYGRGKRAREVRSYEEHWSEEESEKICKADSPGSPRVKEVIEQTLPTVASGPVMVIGETGELTPPKLPPQPSVELPTQQSKEVTPPSRRGRGRPKRATTEVTPPPMVLPVQPSVNKMDLGSQIGKVSSCPTVPGPDSLPNSTTVNSIGGTIQQFGVFIAPSFQSTPPLFSIPPASQSTAIPGPCMPVQVRGRGRKIQSGVEAPRRRGKKQSTILTTVPVLPAPSGTGNPDFVSQGVAVSSSPLASGPDSVYGSTIATNISKEPVAVSPVLPGFPAPSGTNKVDIGLQRDPVSSSPMGCKPDLRSQGVTVSGSPSASGPDSVSGSTIEKDIIREPLPTSPLFPCIPASTGTDKVDIGLQRGPVSNSPMVSGSSVVTGISGTEHALGVQDVPSSQPTPPLPSVTQCSIPPSHSVPEQVRGRGRKAQSAIEAPRRRGKRQDPVIPVVPPDGLTDLNPKSNEPSQKKSRVSGVKMSITTRSKRENDAQKLINVIQALPCKVPNPDGLAGQDSNLTEQSDNSAQNKQQTSTSAPNNLASLTQDKTGNSENRVDAPTEMKNVNFSAENKASPSRANLPVEQVHAAGTKGAALMINKVSCETSSAEIKNDKSLGSGEDAPTLPVSSNTFIEATENQSLDGKSSLASSTSGTAPVFDFPVEKFEGQFEKEGGGKVEEEKSHVMDEFVAPKPMVCEPDNKRTDQDHCHEKSGDNEAQKLTDFVHVQACQVLSPDGFAGQDTKSAEQLDCSLQNRLETSSLATIDVAVGFPVKNSTDIEVKEVGTPTKSKDGRLSKESEASPNCAYSPTGQIYNADVKDGGAARQEIPCETLLVEAQIGESFGSEGGDAPTLSVSSNSLIEVPVNQSLTDKANFSLSTLEMDPVSNLPSGKCPSLSEKEGGERVENEKHPVLDESVTRKPKVSDLGRKITDGSHCDEKGGENEAEIFNTQACEVFTPAGSAGQDSKSSEQADYSAQSKPETSSAAAIDAIVSFPVGKSAYLEVHAPTKSKDGDLSKEIECSETFRDPSAEQIHTSNLAPTMLEVPYESPLSDSKINECLSSEGGDAQALPLSSNIASEVIMNPPSDNEIYSVLSTTKMDAVCDPLIDQSESQSGKEGAQKIEEENNIGRDRSGSSKPKVFTLESETETVACVTDIAHSKRLIDESFGSAGGSSPNGHISSGNLVEVTEDQSPEGINEKSGKVVAEEEENVERVLDKVAVSEPEIIQSSMGNLISSVEAAATPPLDFPVDNKSVDQSEKADIK